jgi:hypothetical protein
LSEEFADSDIVGTPYGPTRQDGKFLIEKQGRTLVGKDYGNGREVVSVLLENIFGYV